MATSPNVNPPPAPSTGLSPSIVGGLASAGALLLGTGPLGAIAAGIIGMAGTAVSSEDNQRTLRNAKDVVNDVVNEGLGHKVEAIIRQGVAAANEPADPLLVTALTLAELLQDGLTLEGLDDEAREGIDGIGEQLSATIQQILDMPQPPEGSPRRLNDEHRATLRDLKEILDNGEGDIEELQNHLRNGIAILLGQQGLTDQVHHTVQKVLGSAQKVLGSAQKMAIETIKEVKEQATGKPHESLIHMRDAIHKLQNEITYCAVKRSDLTRSAQALTDILVSDSFFTAISNGDTLTEAELDVLMDLGNILVELENEETPDAQLPRKEAVIPVFKQAYALLDRYIHEKSGVTTRAFDGATQTGRKLLIDVPSDAWSFWRGKNAEIGPIIIAPPGDAPTTLMGYLTAMSAQLRTYLERDEVNQTISDQVVTSMGSALLMALNGALASVEGKENLETVHHEIESFIERLNELMARVGPQDPNLPRAPATVAELYNLVGESIGELSSVTVYINNLFRVPGFGKNNKAVNTLETPFLSNIFELEETAESQVQGADYWEKKADEEKNKFINSTKNFLILKFIYEKVCGLTTHNQFYLDLIRDISTNEEVQQHLQAMNNDDPALRDIHEARLREINDAHLRSALFNGLDRADFTNVRFGSIRRRLARAAYTIVAYFLNRFVQNLGKNYLKEAFDYIQENKILGIAQRANLNEDDEDAINADEDTVRFNELKSTLVENFTRYLMTTNGAYRRVADNPLVNGSLTQMRAKELARREVNDGATPEELYGAFAKNVIKKSMNSSFLAWLFITFFGGQEAVIEGIIDQSVGSLMDANGYTHALNTVFVDLLKDILKLIKDNEEAGTQGPTQTYQDTESRQNKAKMRALVKNLFEILEKNKCQTQDDLIALFRDPSLSRKLVKTGDDLFMEDVVESVADILTLAIRELLTEEKLNRLIYQFTGLVNQVYQSGQNFRAQEVRAKEIELNHLTNQLLVVSISGAVKKKFDFMGGQEQTETNQQIDLLRRQTQTLVDVVSPLLDAVEQPIQHDNLNPLENTNLLTHLKTIADTTSIYLKKCQTDRFNSQGSQLNSDNIDKLDKIYRTADNNMRRFVRNINKMLKAQKKIAANNALTPHIEEIRRLAHAIPARFPENSHSRENIERSKADVHRLEELVRTTEQIIQDPTISALRNSLTTLAQSLQSLEDQVAIIEFNGLLYAQEGQPPVEGQPQRVTLQQIMRERRQHLVCSDSVKELIRTFKTQIPVCLEPAVRLQLIQQLDKIQSSIISPQIDAAYGEFIRVADVAQQAAGDRLRNQKEMIRRDSQRIHTQLGQLDILAPNYIQNQKEIIRASFPEAQRGLRQIRRSYLHTSLVDAEKNASALVREIEKKEAELEEVPPELQANKLAEIRAELAPKIAEVTTPLEFLQQHGPVVFHHDGEITEETNLENDHIVAVAGQFITFTTWQEGLPDDITLEAAKQQAKDLIELLQQLKRTQSQHNAFAPIRYYNVNAFDTHGAKDLVTGLVFNRVKERADGLIDLISSEEFFRDGLFRYMFLIPYLKRNNAMPKHTRGPIRA